MKTRNINELSREELEALPELGTVLAGRVHHYIRENGRIERVTDLPRVFGISYQTAEVLSNHVHGDMDEEAPGEDILVSHAEPLP